MSEMLHRKLLWQLFPSYLLIILLSLAAVTIYTSLEIRRFYLDRTSEELLVRVMLLQEQFREHVIQVEPDRIDDLCKELGRNASTRITVILPDGVVVGDAEEDPSRMDNHANRPEIREALQGKIGSSTRRSPTLNKQMMYVAAPVWSRNQVIAVVRTSLPLISIGQTLSPMYTRIVLAGLVIAALAAVINLFVSRKISYPLEQIRLTAESYAKGDFSKPLPDCPSDEIFALARSMRDMAKQLDDQIKTITNQRNEREAILSSMIEGVLAFNDNQQLISINRAASDILDIEPSAVVGKYLVEVVRNLDLHNFVSSVLQAKEKLEMEITFRELPPRYIQVYGTAMLDVNGKHFGAVIVLNDVTHIRALENVRRDFVANISHELKTPITTIKGFIETLLSGALEKREEAEHFLDVIAKQVDRLNSIIDDLLLLSRIEREAMSIDLGLEELCLSEFLHKVIAGSGFLQNARGIRINIECNPDLSSKFNPRQLETAVLNLIDNAVKYSPDGELVTISCEENDNELVISVRDNGPGIDRAHQPRLFERFYRIDKGRNRDIGGTGLGLAIVKHIAQTHRGRVSVESAPGKGSTFRIHLPS